MSVSRASHSRGNNSYPNTLHVLLQNSKHWFNYDILSSTTAVFSYAIGSRKLSANEQFFYWCSNSSKCVINNSHYMRRLVYNRMTMLLTPAQIKPKSFESEQYSFFTRGGCASFYVRAWAQGFFYSHISTRTFRRALTASVDSCAEMKSASSVT